MSEEQLKAFLEKVKDDTNLQEKLKADADADADAVAAIAKDAGFSISADDQTQTELYELSDELSDEVYELSDEELEGVAGGWKTKNPSIKCYWSIIVNCPGNPGPELGYGFHKW